MAPNNWVLRTEQRLRMENVRLERDDFYEIHPFLNSTLDIYSADGEALHQLGESGVCVLAQLAMQVRLTVLRPEGKLWRARPRPWRQPKWWQKLWQNLTGRHSETPEPLFPNAVRAAGIEVSTQVLPGYNVRIEFERDGIEIDYDAIEWLGSVRAIAAFTLREDKQPTAILYRTGTV